MKKDLNDFKSIKIFQKLSQLILLYSQAYTKIKVDNHAFNKENMPSHFKVKEYCPLVFRNLRERFGIDDASYMKSLTRQGLLNYTDYNVVESPTCYIRPSFP